MPEDIAITSSKSDVDPFSHGRDPDGQKSADRQTDRQTDGFSTLYSRLASLPALSCRCMGIVKQINLKPSFA